MAILQVDIDKVLEALNFCNDDSRAISTYIKTENGIIRANFRRLSEQDISEIERQYNIGD